MADEDGTLFRRVADTVSRRIEAMEMAGDAPFMDRQEITLLIVRRLEMRRPNLPQDGTALQEHVEREVARYMREDRKLWSATRGARDEPSRLVLELLRRGMRAEAIKRYCHESGLSLRDATRVLDEVVHAGE